MVFTSPKILFTILAVIVIAAGLIVLWACGGDDKQDNTPQIVGCNQVRYQGYTFNLGAGGGGCQPGIASFDVTITQNGHTASFHIVCSGGCISSVTVLSGSPAPTTITGP
jgi:hypothetical protein